MNYNFEQALRMIKECFGPDLWHIYHEDRDTEDIILNPDGKIWVNSIHGKTDSGLRLKPNDALTILSTIASLNHQTLTRNNPKLSAIIPGRRARIEGWIAPATPNPSFVIRIPSLKFFSLEQYVQSGTLTARQAELIQYNVERRKNILVVGSTGSGKTTLANAIIDKMTPFGHRIITIEDVYELRCVAPDTLSMLVERGTSFDFRAAVFSAMRGLPDRIVVGELRDGEAAHELLKAWNTGHNGGLATIHANSAKSALPRLESLLAERDGHTPRDLIAEAIDLVIFIRRLGPNHPSGLTRCVEDVATLFDDLDEQGRYQFNHRWHDLVEPR